MSRREMATTLGFEVQDEFIDGQVTQKPVYVGLWQWHERTLRITVEADSYVAQRTGKAEMWTPGGWQRCVQGPKEEIDNLAYKALTLSDFDGPVGGLLLRALLVIGNAKEKAAAQRGLNGKWVLHTADGVR